MGRGTARSGYRASSALFWPILAELRERNVDAGVLLAKAELSAAELDDPDVRHPLESLLLLGALAAQALGDPAFGLHLAERYRPHVFGLLDYLARSSGTLGQALKVLCRYNRLLQDAVEMVIERRGDTVVVWQRCPGGLRLPPGVNENAIANLIVIARDLTGMDLAPREATFVHARPPYSAEHTRIFRAPVRFDAERDGMVVPADMLDLPVRGADPKLSAILERHARNSLASIPRVPQFSQRVRGMVLERLRAAAPTAAGIARELGVSERTLGRRLQAEGATFERILDGLRRDLAARYLKDPRFGTDDVSLMLGYAEANAFRRAFRRWYGIGPGAYRRGGWRTMASER